MSVVFELISATEEIESEFKGDTILQGEQLVGCVLVILIVMAPSKSSLRIGRKIQKWTTEFGPEHTRRMCKEPGNVRSNLSHSTLSNGRLLQPNVLRVSSDKWY